MERSAIEVMNVTVHVVYARRMTDHTNVRTNKRDNEIVYLAPTCVRLAFLSAHVHMPQYMKRPWSSDDTGGSAVRMGKNKACTPGEKAAMP